MKIYVFLLFIISNGISHLAAENNGLTKDLVGTISNDLLMEGLSHSSNRANTIVNNEEVIAPQQSERVQYHEKQQRIEIFQQELELKSLQPSKHAFAQLTYAQKPLQYLLVFFIFLVLTGLGLMGYVLFYQRISNDEKSKNSH